MRGTTLVIPDRVLMRLTGTRLDLDTINKMTGIIKRSQKANGKSKSDAVRKFVDAIIKVENGKGDPTEDDIEQIAWSMLRTDAPRKLPDTGAETAIGRAHGYVDGSDELLEDTMSEVNDTTGAAADTTTDAKKKAASKKPATKAAPAKKGAAAKGKTAAKAAPAKKGNVAPKPRVSKFADKRLTAIKAENPRREGSHGHKSYEIIRKNPGISYDAYIADGGRAADLVWNVNKGYVKAANA